MACRRSEVCCAQSTSQVVVAPSPRGGAVSPHLIWDLAPPNHFFQRRRHWQRPSHLRRPHIWFGTSAMAAPPSWRRRRSSSGARICTASLSGKHGCVGERHPPKNPSKCMRDRKAEGIRLAIECLQRPSKPWACPRWIHCHRCPSSMSKSGLRLRGNSASSVVVPTPHTSGLVGPSRRPPHSCSHWLLQLSFLSAAASFCGSRDFWSRGFLLAAGVLAFDASSRVWEDVVVNARANAASGS